ncbi:MAG: polysaccharide deacetylase family protein [Deinococcales bacterium]
MTVAGGGLVLSLDFELGWGVADTLAANGGYRRHLLGAREAVPRILERFAAHGVGATWATVGMLFATSREELVAHAPPAELRPRYRDPRLDVYRLQVGEDERRDPLHYAPSLIDAIAACPGQRIGSHSFAHYYSLERGQTRATFEADLQAAVTLAAARSLTLRSYVWPRHQLRADYLPILARHGFTVHRGPEPNVLNRPHRGAYSPLAVRAARLTDAYLGLTGPNLVRWSALTPVGGLVDVPESRFLRPVAARATALEPLRLHRITTAMRRAAATGALFHLWWHPHN